MGRRLAVLAGPHRQALIALLAIAAPAAAAPKSRAAKVQFDKGVAAYKKSDFAAAREDQLPAGKPAATGAEAICCGVILTATLATG